MSPASSATTDKNHDTSNSNAVTSADTQETDTKSRSEIHEIDTTAKKESGHYPQHLHPAFNHDRYIQRVPSPDTLSEISVGENGLLRPGRGSIALQPLRRVASRSPGPASAQSKLQDFWTRNKGLAYVLLAQIFGVLMNVTTRYAHAHPTETEC